MRMHEGEETIYEVCNCDCHKGVGMFEFMACCNLCGKAYKDEDGVIDQEKLYDFLNPPQPKKRKHRL